MQGEELLQITEHAEENTGNLKEIGLHLFTLFESGMGITHWVMEQRGGRFKGRRSEWSAASGAVSRVGGLKGGRSVVREGPQMKPKKSPIEYASTTTTAAPKTSAAFVAAAAAATDGVSQLQRRQLQQQQPPLGPFSLYAFINPRIGSFSVTNRALFLFPFRHDFIVNREFRIRVIS